MLTRAPLRGPSDAFQKREKANEDYTIRQREKEKLLELKKKLGEQQAHLKQLEDHMYVHARGGGTRFSCPFLTCTCASPECNVPVQFANIVVSLRAVTRLPRTRVVSTTRQAFCSSGTAPNMVDDDRRRRQGGKIVQKA